MVTEHLFLGGRPTQGFGVGAIERRNPLPPGRYWIDLFEPHNAEWLAWRAKNAQSVKVEETEHVDGDPPRDFVIFNVSTPVPWEGPGFPTIAGASVKTSTDTRDRPDPEQFPDESVTNWISEGVSPNTKMIVGTIVVLAGGVFALYVIHQATAQPARRPVRA